MAAQVQQPSGQAGMQQWQRQHEKRTGALTLEQQQQKERLVAAEAPPRLTFALLADCYAEGCQRNSQKKRPWQPVQRGLESV